MTPWITDTDWPTTSLAQLDEALSRAGISRTGVPTVTQNSGRSHVQTVETTQGSRHRGDVRPGGGGRQLVVMWRHAQG
ncbi:MAG: hypothetical protein ACI8S6_003481 [Myxococcota bacterium]|jgi:hypothetical protein